MTNTQNRTIRELITQIAEYSYDHGDYNVTKNTFRDDEVKAFVESYLPGAEILKNGQNGEFLTIKGKAEENKGTTGDEVICCHDYQIYDLSGQTGDWVIVTFKTKEDVENHILSEGGYLNVYCTEMIVFKDGVIQPFEVLFAGDNDITLSIDKDRFDEGLDVKAMRDRISVNWLPLEEDSEENKEEQ